MPNMPSGSNLPLAMVCPASAVLPKVQDVNAKGQLGTDKHDFLRALGSMPRDEALARASEPVRQWAEELDLDRLPIGAGWQHEAAFAYDVVSEKVRFIGFDIGRNYGERETPSEQFLSVDVMASLEGEAFAADWKTGDGYVTGAADNWQVKLAALVVAKHFGAERAKGAVILLREGRQPYIDVAEWDEFDLAMFASELRMLHTRLQKPTPETVMGDHCKYCKAFTSCPAQGRLIARLAVEPEQVGEEALLDLTPETAWRAWARLKAVKAVAGKVEKALYAYAATTPILLPDGAVLGMVESEREELDALVVRTVLVALHGPAVAEKACDFETSKAAIERALRGVVEEKKRGGQKTTLKALMAEALEEVRRLGGVTLKTKTEVREHRPKDAPAPQLPEVANG